MYCATLCALTHSADCRYGKQWHVHAAGPMYVLSNAAAGFIARNTDRLRLLNVNEGACCACPVAGGRGTGPTCMYNRFNVWGWRLLPQRCPSGGSPVGSPRAPSPPNPATCAWHPCVLPYANVNNACMHVCVRCSVPRPSPSSTSTSTAHTRTHTHSHTCARPATRWPLYTRRCVGRHVDACYRLGELLR